MSLTDNPCPSQQRHDNVWRNAMRTSTGLTTVIDNGLPTGVLTDLVESHGQYIGEKSTDIEYDRALEGMVGD
jgi:hypothetical protein